MDIKQFIDNAFEKYEDSSELIDFKEELLTNLRDRLASLESKGMKRSDAIKEIQTEFVDINKIADEMSLAKKKEVFEMQYMSFRHFVTKKQAAFYSILGSFTLLGIICIILSYLASNELGILTEVLIMFLTIPLSGFIYMGLTQETAKRHSMHPTRALIYTVASFVFLFGVFLVPILIFGEAKSLESVITILIPFTLPSAGLITYLIFTESDYRKAWILKEAEKYMKWGENFETSGNAQTFGIITAAIWVLAIGLFIFLLILKLWIYSWIPFILAFVVMMFLLAHYMKKSA